MKKSEESIGLKGWAIVLVAALVVLPVLSRLSDASALAVQGNSNRVTPRTRNRARKPVGTSNQNQNAAPQPSPAAGTQNSNSQSSNSNGQTPRPAYQMAPPRSDVKLEKTMIFADKDVPPEMIVPSGGEITYATVFTNLGTGVSRSLTIIDPIQDVTDFKLGSVTNELGTTGLEVTVSYSKDGGENCDYTPVSGGGGAPAGFDRLVNAVCWKFSGDLSFTAPNNTGRISYVGRRR